MLVADSNDRLPLGADWLIFCMFHVFGAVLCAY